jgi:hypothetical protein
MAKAGNKFSPIKLRSLKDARYQLKSSRPESATRLNESFSKIDLLNEELRKRSVISLSPTASSEQLEISPRLFDHKEIFFNESKEGSPAPVFNETFKPDLPEINEMLPTEEVLEEEKSEEKGRKSEGKEDYGKNLEKNRKKEGKDIDKGESVNFEKLCKVRETDKNSQKTILKKMPSGKGIVQRNKKDVLEFMEERKMKKKLTKSQERGLLDRLQGFSTKFLATNK